MVRFECVLGNFFKQVMFAHMVLVVLSTFVFQANALYCYSCRGEKENWKCNEKEPVRCSANEVCITAYMNGFYKRCMDSCPMSRGDGDSAPCKECTGNLCNAPDFSDKAHLVAEKPKSHTSRAPDGSKYVLHVQPTTYWEARMKCMIDGGTMASVHSLEVQRFIRKSFVSDVQVASFMVMAPRILGIDTNSYLNINGFWFGLKNFLNADDDEDVANNVWIWTDDGSVVRKIDTECRDENQNTYQNWKKNHPIVPTTQDQQLCGFVSRTDNGRWQSISCGQTLPAYLCHYPSDVIHNSIAHNNSIYTFIRFEKERPHQPTGCSKFGRRIEPDNILVDKFLINDDCAESESFTRRKREITPLEVNDCEELSPLICKRPLYKKCSESVSTSHTNRSLNVEATTTNIPTTFQTHSDTTDKSTLSAPKLPSQENFFKEFCEQHKRIDGSEIFTFPRTKIRSFGYSLEKCPNGIPKALMLCTGRPTVSFKHFARLDCGRSLSDALNQISMDINEESISLNEATGKLHFLSLLRSNFTSDDMTHLIEILFRLSENNSEIAQNVFSNIVAATAKLRRYFARHGKNETHKVPPKYRIKLERALANFAQLVNINTNDTRHKFEADGIEVEVVKLDPYDTGTGQIERGFSVQHSGLDRRSSIMVLPDSPSSGHIPEYEKQKQFRAVFMSYDGDELFPTDEEVEVNSVISATVTDGEKTYSVPVEFSMQVSEDLNISSGMCVKKECRYYDHSEQIWKTDGCRVEAPVIGQRTDVVRCKCDHTTSFAVVVSQHVRPNYALDVASTIGMIICILCLILTIGIFLIAPELRRVRSAFTHINLCACLSIAYFVFLIGIEATSNRMVCVTVAALIHFFLLAAWGWMAVESITMYRMFVRTFDRRNNKDRGVKWAIVVYAVAVAIVLTTISFSILSRYMQWDKGAGCETDVWSTYIADSYCWLQGNSLYFGFLLIIGIGLAFNIGFSAVIIKAITWGRKSVQSSVEEKPFIHVLRAVLVALLLGVAWIFAIPLVISSDAVVQEVFGWLFAITISAQGMFIFYFFCLRRKDVRQSWTGAVVNIFSNKSKQGDTSGTTATPISPPPSTTTTKFGKNMTSSVSEMTRKTNVSVASSFTSPRKDAKSNSDKCVYKPKCGQNDEEPKTLDHSLDLVEFNGEDVFGS